MTTFYPLDLFLLLPEIVLAVSALAILLEGALRKNAESWLPERFANNAILVCIVAFLLLFFFHTSGKTISGFEGQLIHDDFTYFAKFLVLLGSAAVVCVSVPGMMKDGILSYEYSSLILFTTLGMLLMVGANDFLMLFIGLELQALTLYVLAGLDKKSLSSSEAALKFFILGALATCFYLYGASFIYGYSGSTNFNTLAFVIRADSEAGFPLGLVVSLIFIIAALAFKVSAVPFHMWTPDVYQGCPTPITTFIAAAPKVAGMIVLLRLLVFPFSQLYEYWQMITVALSLASMILGSFAALRQSDIKRLLGYSAISQMGYVLLALAAGNEEGIQAIFVYLALYLVMIIGVFGCLLSLRGRGKYDVHDVEDLAGLSLIHPKIAAILAIFMFSLAGIPPLAGFFAKFYVFKAAIAAGLFKAAIIGVLMSVVAAYYYIRIVKVMYFDAPPDSESPSLGQTIALSPAMVVVLNVCAVIALLFFLYPMPLLEMANQASLAVPSVRGIP